MVGDAQVRFCDRCGETVHDLTAMHAADAEALLRERGAGLCGRIAGAAVAVAVAGGLLVAGMAEVIDMDAASASTPSIDAGSRSGPDAGPPPLMGKLTFATDESCS